MQGIRLTGRRRRDPIGLAVPLQLRTECALEHSTGSDAGAEPATEPAPGSTLGAFLSASLASRENRGLVYVVIARLPAQLRESSRETPLQIPVP